MVASRRSGRDSWRRDLEEVAMEIEARDTNDSVQNHHAGPQVEMVNVKAGQPASLKSFF